MSSASAGLGSGIGRSSVYAQLSHVRRAIALRAATWSRDAATNHMTVHRGVWNTLPLVDGIGLFKRVMHVFFIRTLFSSSF